MKGIIILESTIQDVIFEKIPAQNRRYADIGGIKHLTVVEWDDLVFKTNKAIEPSLTACPFVLFFGDNLIEGRNSSFTNVSGEQKGDGSMEYKYTVHSDYLHIYFGMEDINKHMDYDILQIIKAIVIKRRNEQE